MNPLSIVHGHSPSRLRRAGKAAVALVLLWGSIGAGSIALADEPTAQELLEEIQKLQAQVQKLQAEEAARQGGQTPPAQPDASARVLADAQRRAAASPLSLMADDPPPFLAGHDGSKYKLASADGNFELVPNIQIQIRNVTSFNNEGGDDFSDIENGWEIRRLKLGAKGHAFTKALKYDIRFAFKSAGGEGGIAVLENAFIDYVPEEMFGVDNLGVRAGQFKDLTFIEESVSSSKQTAVDRSLVNESIGGGNTDFIQGAGPMLKGEKWQGILLYTDGANSDNTPWNDVTWDYGFAARFDLVFMGDKDSVMEDFTALDTEENSARVGAGFHYSAVGDSRTLHHGVDAQFESDGGLGILGAYYGRLMEVDGGSETFDVGGLVQVSQLIGDDGWEAFVRYDFIMFEDELVLGPGAEDFFHEFTAGVNKYCNGHKSKFTFDVVYLPNGNPGSNTGIGLRPSDGEFGDQVALRAQYQLLQ